MLKLNCLAALGCALAIAQSGEAASSEAQATGELGETSQLLREMRMLTRMMPGRVRVEWSAGQAQRQIDAALASIDRVQRGQETELEGDVPAAPGLDPRGTHCDEPACAYLQTGEELAQPIKIEVAGTVGAQTYTFTSGVSIGAIVKAIKLFAAGTGVDAEICDENPQRVELCSVLTGAGEFVSVDQIAGTKAVVFEYPIGGTGMYEFVDFGLDGIPGDIDCSGGVDVVDLVALLAAWGVCEGCPEDVTGDGVVDVVDLLALLEHWGPRGYRG